MLTVKRPVCRAGSCGFDSHPRLDRSPSLASSRRSVCAWTLRRRTGERFRGERVGGRRPGRLPQPPCTATLPCPAITSVLPIALRSKRDVPGVHPCGFVLAGRSVLRRLAAPCPLVTASLRALAALRIGTSDGKSGKWQRV